MMRARKGVSLIEVMVALTLFGLIVTVHTVATMRYGLRLRVAALGAARSTALAQAVDLYATMPKSSLGANVGCSTVTAIPRYEHRRCVTASAINGNVSRFTIVLTPTNTSLRPDTAIVDRVTTNFTPPFK